MMRRPGNPPTVLLLVLVFVSVLFPAGVLARSPVEDLRREKARLLEMKAKEEKAAAELSEALRKEKLTKERVGELRERLNRQKQTIARIDREIGSLNARLSRTGMEVKALEEAQDRAHGNLRAAAGVAFTGILSRSGFPGSGFTEERDRYLMRVYLGADLEDVRRLESQRERKEEELTGIERQVERTGRKMEKERKVGETLLSRQAEERKRLEGIAQEKRRKEKELKALRTRIARLESLVTRVERQVREREKRGGKSARLPERPGSDDAARRFAAVPGGMTTPLAGKTITRFGRQHDPTFDVTIENRGVEIEGPSAAVVRSVGKGEVAFAGGVSGFGNVLILQHGSGLFSVYGKLESYAVRQGDTVGKGQVVGRLPESPSGKSVLYLELRAGGTAVDPASVIPLIR